MKVKVKANSNIALIKYWGKRNEILKLPQNSSLSLTLDNLSTTTEIEIIESEKDIIVFNGEPSSEKEYLKITKYLDLVRNMYGKQNLKFKINTKNNFPTAAGLASSASGYCALAESLNAVLDLKLSKSEISILARLGSGSASRSIYGGFVEWQKGELDDGSDSHAIQITNEDYWDLNMIVVVVNNEKKKTSSTAGMKETMMTSPFYQSWLDTLDDDLSEIKKGIREKDFTKVGEIMEHNCLKMHSTMITTKPSVIYWQPKTIEVIQLIKTIREKGLECYFTIDAGPNVKVLCENNNLEKIKVELNKIEEIDLIVCKIGGKPIIEKVN